MAGSGCSSDVGDDPDPEVMVNGHFDHETQSLHRKLSLLSPVPNKHLPLYLGEGEHSSRALVRDAISPSPRQDERRRAEEKSGEALADLADCYRGILVGIGEDPGRHGLRQTPERAARAMLYFTKGYDEKIEGKSTTGGKFAKGIVKSWVG